VRVLSAECSAEQKGDFMCEHKKDDRKKPVFISLLCRKCAAQERFDEKQILLLFKKQTEDNHKLFLK